MTFGNRLNFRVRKKTSWGDITGLGWMVATVTVKMGQKVWKMGFGFAFDILHSLSTMHGGLGLGERAWP